MKLLLVDDEPRLLDAMRRLLATALDEGWHIATAPSGAEALRMIALDPPDILLTDMRMPEMNGAQLLARVHQEHPDIVRMVLSGQMDDATAICAVPHAHQFLSKPCPAAVLVPTLESAAVLRGLLQDVGLRASINALPALRATSATYSTLRAALAVPTTTPRDVARIVGSDPALAAKVLHLVNGGFFGARSPVTNVEEAVQRLGMRTIQTLVFSEVLVASTPRDPPPEAFVVELRDQAVRRLQAAHHIAPHLKDAAAAALLCDVGRLVLAAAKPEAFAAIAASPGRCEEGERRALGVTHAEAGAYLLGLWGLPLVVVDAVAHHHSLGAASGVSAELAAVVHVADAFVAGQPLDEAGLDAIGMLERSRPWVQALAGRAAA